MTFYFFGGGNIHDTGTIKCTIFCILKTNKKKTLNNLSTTTHIHKKNQNSQNETLEIWALFQEDRKFSLNWPHHDKRNV